MTRKILFTGSRDANPEMLRLAREYLDSLVGWDVHIIVGDADGVDYQVVMICDEKDISVECHGAYQKMRFKTWTGKNFAHDTDYLGRDRIMANLLEPGDECVAVWNGKWKNGIVGRSGTVTTARYARERGAVVTWLYKIPIEE